MSNALRISAILTVALIGLPASSMADTPWKEGFEGPETSWRESGSDAQYRIVRHERMHEGARSGSGCETVVVEGSMGTYVHLEHPVGRPPVIDELRPSLWVRADRAGLQLAARVVLPRTPDPRTGSPVSTLILGSAYTEVGSWQQLVLDELPQRLARQVRALRMELGPSVDGREAFVDAVVLNVYGGPGVTTTWIDDLEVAGHVGAQRSEPTRETTPARVIPMDPYAQAAGNVAGATRPPVALSGGVLTVDGRPFLPRAVEYRGEPTEQLGQMGFNALWLETAPSSALLDEVNRLGLWLICPPPDSLHQAADPADPAEAAARFAIGPEYDAVLVWHLGRNLTAADLETTRQRIDRVRAADGRRGRPILCGAASDLRGYSRYADILLLDRRPLGSSLELRDYGLWVQRQPRLARPGTPVWTTVQTQPSAALYEQLAALEPQRRPPTSLPYEQIGLLAQTALGAGSRGLLFLTESDFLESDAKTQRRAMALELVNAHLSLLEPWAATGSIQASIESGHRDLVGSILRVNRSRLVIPLWSSAAAQYVPDWPTSSTLSMVVPGVPESANAYEIGPGGLVSTKHQRVTGGLQLTLDEFGLWSSVVLAQDPLLVSRLGGRATELGPRAAQLCRDLTADALRQVNEIERQLPTGSIPAESAARAREAHEHLRRADASLAASEPRQAIEASRQAMRILGILQRRQWEAAAAMLNSPVTSPGACSFATLPWHWRLGARIEASQYGRNQLPGGDFERLELLLQTGWQHRERHVEGCRSAVDLAVEAARSGEKGLRLAVRPEDPDSPPAVVESPPVWIVSPGVAVEAGQLMVIHGYAKIPKAVDGSVDGLMVFDSLSGEILAERIGRTKGWQPFTLFRVAPRSGSLRVTFALTGLGEAYLDDVTIRPLHHAAPPATARLP